MQQVAAFGLLSKPNGGSLFTSDHLLAAGTQGPTQGELPREWESANYSAQSSDTSPSTLCKDSSK